MASTVATSPLFKTAIYGRDANWGRVLAAIGRSYPSPAINPGTVSLSFYAGDLDAVPKSEETTLRLVKNGQPCHLDESMASKILNFEDVTVEISLGQGDVSATYWTCDFSHEYVSINAEYRT